MKVIAALILGLFSIICAADTLKVEYSSFYSHLKKIDDDDTQALQFAFGFKNIHATDLCTIIEANIITQKVTLPVTVSAEQRFTLPTEKALKQAKAVLQIDMLEKANQCDLSVQLETKARYLNKTYMQKELVDLLTQFDLFFDDAGGFMSFLLPDVTGLQMHFSDELPANLPDGLRVEGKQLYLSKEWVNQMNTITLPAAPFRITATTD